MNADRKGPFTVQPRSGSLAERITAATEKYKGVLLFLYALCWTLLFFRHSFDFTERLFRIPLLLLSVPLLLSLRQHAAFSYLGRAPQFYCVVLMVLAAYIAAAACPFPDVRSFSHIVFGWAVLTLAGYAMKLTMPDKALRLMLLGVVSGLVASAAWALTGTSAGWTALEDVWTTDNRLTLFSGYPATLGLMASFALTGQFFFRKHGRPIISHKADLALLLIVLALLLLTQARAALGAFAVAAVFILISASPKPLRALLLVSVCGVLLIGILYGLGQTSVLKSSPPYQRMLSVISHPMQDSSLTGRLGIWEAAAKSIQERPVTGVGMRMFPRAYEAYMEKNQSELQAKYPYVESEGGHAHNLALGALTELGLVGFLPLLCIYMYALLPRKAAPASDVRCLQALFLFFLMHGLIDYMLSKIIYSDLFFGTVGLFMGTMYFQCMHNKRTGNSV